MFCLILLQLLCLLCFIICYSKYDSRDNLLYLNLMSKFQLLKYFEFFIGVLGGMYQNPDTFEVAINGYITFLDKKCNMNNQERKQFIRELKD